MGRALQLIKELVARGEIRISEHGYAELAAGDISIEDMLNRVAEAECTAHPTGGSVYIIPTLRRHFFPSNTR